MKRTLPCVLVAAFIAAGAYAQEATMICHRNEDGTCTWVAEREPVQELTPGDATSSGARPVIIDQETTMLLDWHSTSLVADPRINYPGSCARRPDYARYRFAAAMAVNDLNRLLATYNWRGITGAQSEGLIWKLGELPPLGRWERTVVSSSFGEPVEMGSKSRPPVYWRWSDGNLSTHFQMKEVDGCWFVEFSADPGSTVVLTHKPNSERVLTSPEPGIFDF